MFPIRTWAGVASALDLPLRTLTRYRAVAGEATNHVRPDFDNEAELEKWWRSVKRAVREQRSESQLRASDRP